jgi:NAD(P)-dependent dehydrogenase (short-subunit alcohol dehydrogenase family)
MTVRKCRVADGADERRGDEEEGTRLGETSGRMAGKVAVITGASTGIGAGIAALFVREGASVALMARREDVLDQAVARLDAPGRVLAVPGDVGAGADARRLVDQALDRFGRIDVFVANAGIHRVAPFLETTDETWDEVFATNVRGAFLTCRAAATAMVAGGGGSIVVVSSTNGVVAEPHMAAYNASKAALTLLAKSMAVDLAPYRIRVNVVAPGTIVSEITRPMLDEGFGFGAVPLGRIGDPIDIAWPVLWLASDEAAYVTGATLVVDGGQIAVNGDLPVVTWPTGPAPGSRGPTQ